MSPPCFWFSSEKTLQQLVGWMSFGGNSALHSTNSNEKLKSRNAAFYVLFDHEKNQGNSSRRHCLPSNHWDVACLPWNGFQGLHLIFGLGLGESLVPLSHASHIHRSQAWGATAVTQGMGWRPGIRRREASLQFHQESCFSHPFLAHVIGWISGLWPSEMTTFYLVDTLCFPEPEKALSRENRGKYIRWSLAQFFHILQGLCFFWLLPAWIALQCLPTEVSIDYIYTKCNFHRTYYI